MNPNRSRQFLVTTVVERGRMDEMKRRMAEAKAANAAKMAKVNDTPWLCGPDQTAACGACVQKVFQACLTAG